MALVRVVSGGLWWFRFAVVCLLLIPKIITEIVKLGGSGFCISAENEVQWVIFTFLAFYSVSTYKFERQNFLYGRRNEPKFGTHVRIDTLTLKK